MPAPEETTTRTQQRGGNQQICDGRHSGAGDRVSYLPRLTDTEIKAHDQASDQRNQHQRKRASKCAKPARELNENELNSVVGRVSA